MTNISKDYFREVTPEETFKDVIEEAKLNRCDIFICPEANETFLKSASDATITACSKISFNQLR